MIKLSGQRFIFLIYIALGLLTLAAFEQVLWNEFVGYDDTAYITGNPHVKQGITAKAVVWAFTESHFFMWHPMTSLSHMLDCTIFGLNPAGHHLTNLILHTASVLLLFSVLKKMTGKVWPSAFVAAVFALHPLNVESVAWAAERKNVLSGFFWMLTIAAYIRYAKHPRIANYLLVVLVFSFALMSKPTTVTLPFVLLLLDYWPLQRFRLRQQSKMQTSPQLELPENNYQKQTILRLLAEKIPLLILSAILCVITVVAQKSGGSLKGTEILPLGTRAANALVSYVSYIGKIIYPNHLAVFYPHPGFNLPAWKPVAALVVLVVISASIIYFGLRRPYLITGWLWYFGTLVPVIGIVQSGGQAMADRYTYLPAIGIFIIFSWVFFELLSKWRYRKIVLGTAAGILLAAMLICTRTQVCYWKNSLTLVRHAIEVTENNIVMQNNYGCILSESGQTDEAVAQFNKVLQISPKHINARINLSQIFIKQGKSREAIAILADVLKDDARQPVAYDSLGLAYAWLGEFDLAIGNHSKALELEQDNPEFYCHMGQTLLSQKKYNEAADYIKKGMQIDPQYLPAYNEMGNVLLAQGRLDESVGYFERALLAKKNLPDVYANLGRVYSQLGKKDLAVEYLTEAVKLKPDNAAALNNLAWILATAKNDKLRNPFDAVKFARKACELTKFNQPEVLDTLAVAYAANGRFDIAVRTAEKAISLAMASQQNALADEIQTHLDCYKAGKPYFETASQP